VTVGGILLRIPTTPVPLDMTALVALAAGGLLYPEVKRLYHDWRHSQLLNRLVIAAEAYQKDPRIHYVSSARLEEELRAVGEPVEPAERHRQPTDPDEDPPPVPPAPHIPTRDPEGSGGKVLRHRSRT
jgi:hypothetical protein